MCCCDSCGDLFFNSDDANKYGYSDRCGENDGNAGGGATDIFKTLATFDIASIFAERKRLRNARDVNRILFYFF